MSKWQQPN